MPCAHKTGPFKPNLFIVFLPGSCRAGENCRCGMYLLNIITIRALTFSYAGVGDRTGEVNVPVKCALAHAGLSNVEETGVEDRLPVLDPSGCAHSRTVWGLTR